MNCAMMHGSTNVKFTNNSSHYYHCRMHFFLPLSSIHVAHKGSVNISQLLLSTTIMKMVSTGNVESLVSKCLQGTKHFTESPVRT